MSEENPDFLSEAWKDNEVMWVILVWMVLMESQDLEEMKELRDTKVSLNFKLQKKILLFSMGTIYF